VPRSGSRATSSRGREESFDSDKINSDFDKILTEMTESKEPAPRILVADDDPQVLTMVKDALESDGFEAVTAKDGKEAYKHLQSEKPFAAAILDIVMPHIEGRDLVRYMQSERRLMNIPVIIMTGDLNSRLSSDSFSSGAVAFLPKPFTDSQLKIMLRMFVNAGPTSK
jgi:CheY-like chemotaxis protein